jgi:hypothetical protein
MRSASKRPRLRSKVAVACPSRAIHPKVGGSGRHLEGIPRPGCHHWAARQARVLINGQVGDNHQDAVVAVAGVLNQFRHGFTEGGCLSMRKRSAKRSTTSWRNTGKRI